MVRQPSTDTLPGGIWTVKGLLATSPLPNGWGTLRSNPGADRRTIAPEVVIPGADGFWTDP